MNTTDEIYYPTIAEHERELRIARCCPSCKHSRMETFYGEDILKCDLRASGVPWSDQTYSITVKEFHVCKWWETCK